MNYAAKLSTCHVEGNFYSIQGVYVDGSIGSSISSASFVTEPAKRHIPQVGRLTQCRLQQNWLQLRRRHQRASQKNSSGSTQILLHRQLAYQLEVQKLQSHPLIMKGQEREKQSQFFLTDGFTHSSKYSRVAVLWIGEVEDAKSIDDLITSASTFGALVSDENSWFQDCTWTQEDRNKKEASRNKSPQEKAKLNQRRDHLRAVRLVGWSTVATKKPAIYWKSQ